MAKEPKGKYRLQFQCSDWTLDPWFTVATSTVLKRLQNKRKERNWRIIDSAGKVIDTGLI